MAPIKKNSSVKKITETTLTSSQFLKALAALKKITQTNNAQFFKGEDKTNKFLHIRMSEIFNLAKQYSGMPLHEIELLLESTYYEARMGAVSIMDFQARDKKISSEQKQALFKLYIKRHDRIDNWDLVDRSAPYVVGGYLYDKPRTPLYKLAASKNVWERRSAIVSTYFFIRQNDLEDTFRIAELLIHDTHDLIQKAVGSWIREAGKRDKQQLLTFLDTYAATMPRTTLRYAVEKLNEKEKSVYMAAKKKA